ncbi:hypothetical protein GobsT_31000 [Gemmata obscuriglobus]|uniref:Uncharacterized protein n=1 Tax=Gemmata obscuriglobus TaxID=114 RepID=A0A2Z3GW99_9BACT|nr:hypothetical protein [Gemmata obscuriglobus]AWM38709.1 hypothetical protein C1280_18080 [Gemmata obscuriglobus]QEG28323.1 hypothetical protein GobsT_31000 [Gemmata obscuriglobus]VTS06183.1 Marine sediment metagenome DNA, contig: S01H1_S18100 OS=marine sediment metagenome GN=S01H1_50976 PE=4 SV=1 [Gemmata obscuriglobus UQM 2246]
MTETTSQSVSPIRLNSQAKDKRIWVELRDGEEELLWTVDQILTACRAYNQTVSLADVDRPVRELWKVLNAWCVSQSDAIKTAYLQPTGNGRLLFLVVQPATGFDQELTDALTELDMDIANDDRFELVKMDVRLVTPMSQEQVDAMLRPH